MNEHIPARAGLSQEFACSYLPNRQEQLLVILDPSCYSSDKFESLLALGFRRSGNQIYRPHCPTCSACSSVRVLAQEFIETKSHKRKLNKAKTRFEVKYSNQERPQYYALYSKYISLRHQDGSMYPPDKTQFQSFLLCSWLNITFIELWDQDNLVAVAVTDCMDKAISAIYTFFDPDYEQYSLGTVMILQQLIFAKAQNKHYVYLGYQIDECPKMNYKTQFLPAQKQVKDQWLTI
ncbi:MULTISPECIES: arginyltransferase [Pseudoalteromonas]|jgi:arginyl-tRNA--protein-N-Asp/Glu arginylyltransferase|uniref:Aspartate/glutamate leucyltransferase n=1 Tax=Pseudoalteromonas nigrifaciens TaxID=28109 RepID=A0AAC9UGU7_9GAMM|nr:MULTISPECIES: arginyltransferase [Pseudoalteromonas]ASM54285.1 arginine-tRNA-protein transferase [Pseudoalteromonas nigrifaciens]MBH0073154.1 arginyltransferase [Pseudoalteromonas sp. NZS127]MBH0093002.1 arginyltransferase [Pseudoalteromonas sp. SCQQ13]PCC13051.1 arginyltransferase [Pseudoalteromonas sp. JB197]WMS93317.1 arginyltransferase [Pseudoalteromonas sp. HL-AS2]|tara:strand:- start:5131 stop:5835 length:705 start_codon:yes stop_codon:yes gene_type:complete